MKKIFVLTIAALIASTTIASAAQPFEDPCWRGNDWMKEQRGYNLFLENSGLAAYYSIVSRECGNDITDVIREEFFALGRRGLPDEKYIYFVHLYEASWRKLTLEPPRQCVPRRVESAKKAYEKFVSILNRCLAEWGM